jgi:ribosomal protein S18 acetylase RimI-like enzyme
MIKATENNKNHIIDILTKSFNDNKSTNWAVKKDKKRLMRIAGLMHYACDLCEAQNGAFLSDDQTGAILYDFPRTSKYTISRLRNDIRFILNVIGPERLLRVLKRENYIKKFHPDEEYIYLWFLGVLPEWQGNGTGSKMLSELIDLADKINLPIYLETSNPRNLELYKRFGFSVYHVWDSDFIGFPIWFMRTDKKNL